MFSAIRPASKAFNPSYTSPIRTLGAPAVLGNRRTFASTTPASAGGQVKTLIEDKDNGFGFAMSNPRPQKPRKRGVTEIRGPYYSVWMDDRKRELS